MATASFNGSRRSECLLCQEFEENITSVYHSSNGGLCSVTIYDGLKMCLSQN